MALTKRWSQMKFHNEQYRYWTLPTRFKVVPAGRRCLAEGTLVATPKGPVAIEQLKVDDEIFGFDGKNTHITTVNRTWDNGIQEVIPLGNNNKVYLKATKNHKLLNLLEDNIFVGLIHVKNITKKHKICTISPGINGINTIYLEQLGEPEYLKTYDITVNNKTNLYVLANGNIITSNSGKSELAKRKVVSEALKKVQSGNRPYHNSRYAVCAPVYNQAKRIYWDDLKLLVPKRYMAKPPKESDLILYLQNDVEIHIIGMDKPARIEGTPWDGIILDEYADMRAKAWTDHVRPALSDRKGWCHFVGVPEGRNHYYDLYKYALENVDNGWSVHTWKSADILDPEEIKSAKHLLDEATYKTEYEACHSLDTEVTLYTGQVIKICEVKKGDYLVYAKEDKKHNTIVLSPCRVIASGLTKVKNMFEVTLKDGTKFKASHDHKMKVNGRKIPLEDCIYLEKVLTIDGIDTIIKTHIINKTFLPKEQCWNITVDSPDHSYILANHINNFNSFDEVTGSAYHSFSLIEHCRSLTYNPFEPLILCFDFNVSPGVAVICQEQILPGAFEYIPNPDMFGKGKFALQEAIKSRDPNALIRVPVKGTGVIGEVYVPMDSTTEKVCDKIVEVWGNHKGKVYCYGDATGSNKGTSKVAGSDWDIIERHLRKTYDSALFIMIGRSNPMERIRLNAMNTRLKTMDGTIRMMVDAEACPRLIKDFEGVRLKEDGSGEIDKRKDSNLTHLCFSGSTMVKTHLGYQRLSDIPFNGYIYTPFGMQKYTNGGVIRGNKKTTYVHFSNNEFIDCTPSHLILTKDNFMAARNIGNKSCYFGNDVFMKYDSENDPQQCRDLVNSNKSLDNEKYATAKLIDSEVEQPVYCPTVRCGCFYLANGLLASNSDSLGYYVCEEFPIFNNSFSNIKLIGRY